MHFVLRPLSVLLSAILVAGTVQAQDSNPTSPNEVEELHLRVIHGTQTPVAAAGQPSSQPLVIAVTDNHNAPVSSATVLVRLPTEGPTGVFTDGSRVAVLYTDMSGQVTVNNIRWGSATGTAPVRITASKGSLHAGILFEQTIGSAGSASSAPVVARSKAQPTGQPVGQPVGQPGQVKPKTQVPEEPVLVASASNAATVSSPSDPPNVVINNHPDRQVTGASGRSKKWLWIGLGAAAAAGAAFAFVGKGGSSNNPSTPTTTTTTVGSPTVSIGHP
jgi:hypothetical protein